MRRNRFLNFLSRRNGLLLALFSVFFVAAFVFLSYLASRDARAAVVPQFTNLPYPYRADVYGGSILDGDINAYVSNILYAPMPDKIHNAPLPVTASSGYVHFNDFDMTDSAGLGTLCYGNDFLLPVEGYSVDSGVVLFCFFTPYQYLDVNIAVSMRQKGSPASIYPLSGLVDYRVYYLDTGTQYRFGTLIVGQIAVESFMYPLTDWDYFIRFFGLFPQIEYDNPQFPSALQFNTGYVSVYPVSLFTNMAPSTLYQHFPDYWSVALNVVRDLYDPADAYASGYQTGYGIGYHDGEQFGYAEGQRLSSQYWADTVAALRDETADLFALLGVRYQEGYDEGRASRDTDVAIAYNRGYTAGLESDVASVGLLAFIPNIFGAFVNFFLIIGQFRVVGISLIDIFAIISLLWGIRLVLKMVI
jgi:hypothetical protein